jgi:hypothetical protein
MEHQTVERIPLRAWSWLWMALAEELGPERAAELCGELRFRSACDGLPAPPVELARAVGASWACQSDQDREE